MYHPTATPPILNQQPEPQPPAMFTIPRQQDLINPTYPQISPATSHITDALIQILTQVIQNKQESTNKRLIKNIKIFNATDKSKCIDWLIQVEGVVQFMNTPLKNIVLSQVSPVIYSVPKGLPADAMDEEVKQLILSNFSDAGTMTEAALRLENLKITQHANTNTVNMKSLKKVTLATCCQYR